MDPRTPVLVGVGQWSNRVDRGEIAVEPAELMAEALRRAAADCGTGTDTLRGLEAIRVVSLLSWRYRDPGAAVASRLGASPRDTAVSPVGGNEPQVLVNQACRDIAAGDVDLVAICGAEAWRSRTGVRGSGQELPWTEQDESVPAARPTGEPFDISHPAEIARRIFLPTQVYPLFEQALRHAAGRSIDDHLVHLGELWARFSEIAATNPHAWIQEAMTGEAVRTPSPSNRWICWPYTKVMNANNTVEQGAGLLLCSAERARRLAVPPERWVFPLAATEANDHLAVSHRADLRSSPGIRLAGRRLFELVGVEPDDLAHVDLYSCFPSAVQIAAAELGLPIARPLTVTGGLSFAGGPWSNYVTHAIAAMTNVLRSDPGSLGLVTANGGHVTKHALALYSTEPPATGFRWLSVQDQVDTFPRREVCRDPDGAAEIESWVVQHDRDGEPERAMAACLLDDGRRAWGTTSDADTVADLRSGAEQIGRKVKLTPDGDLRL